MWPFKKLEERICDLEDKIAGKKARLVTIEAIFMNLSKISSYWIEERAELAEQIAALTSRCERMKRMKDK